MNPPLESRPLRQFVAVAEELSFARAAERLTISAPALSRTIARLETQLGVRLFERSTRRVELTAAGRELLESAGVALAALDGAATRAQRAARPERPFVLAIKADLDGGLLEPAIEAFGREPAGGPVDLRFSAWGRQARMITEGEADAALVFQPPLDLDARELDHELLLEEPQVVALPAGHTLAARAAVELADFEAGWERIPGGGLWRPRGAEGERPRVEDMSQLLKLVELGQLIAMLPGSVATRFGRPQIAYRPVRDAEPARLAVAWPRDSRSAATAAFVRVITDLAAARPAAPPRTARASPPASAAPRVA